MFVYTFALVSFFSRLIGNQGDYVQKHSCVFLEVAANRPTLFFNQNKVLNVFSNLTFYRLESGNVNEPCSVRVSRYIYQHGSVPHRHRTEKASLAVEFYTD